ncbi:MAG: AAA family ATPase, partial [Clostridia bacterium]|nr:AAA family ATPase [Clostridia bacterium]
MGISFPGATILHGPPGCGKTYAVEKLAEYLGWKRFDIDSSSIASSFIHDT